MKAQDAKFTMPSHINRGLTRDIHAPIAVDEVRSVYSGKDGNCCCGCSGTHYEADKPENSAMVTRVLRIVNEAIASDEAEWNSDDCVSTTIGKRLYIVYLREIDTRDNARNPLYCVEQPQTKPQPQPSVVACIEEHHNTLSANDERKHDITKSWLPTYWEALNKEDWQPSSDQVAMLLDELAHEVALVDKLKAAMADIAQAMRNAQ